MTDDHVENEELIKFYIFNYLRERKREREKKGLISFVLELNFFYEAQQKKHTPNTLHWV